MKFCDLLKRTFWPGVTECRVDARVNSQAKSPFSSKQLFVLNQWLAEDVFNWLRQWNVDLRIQFKCSWRIRIDEPFKLSFNGFIVKIDDAIASYANELFSEVS